MVEYRFDPERGLLVVTVSGVVGDADFEDAKFPDVPPGTIELLDLSRAERTEISSGEIRRIAQRDLSWPDRISRMAIVATSDVAFGLARMYQTLCDGMKTEVRIFRSRPEAEDWLGLAP